jgi:hypothetical protein
VDVLNHLLVDLSNLLSLLACVSYVADSSFDTYLSLLVDHDELLQETVHLSSVGHCDVVVWMTQNCNEVQRVRLLRLKSSKRERELRISSKEQ